MIYSRYDWVAVTDYDEIFVSKKNLNFEKMMQEIVNTSVTYQSFQFRNTYFMDKMQKAHGFEPDIPDYFTMMKNVYRSSISTDQFKSMHRVGEVLGKLLIFGYNDMKKPIIKLAS